VSSEDEQLRSVALQNAKEILAARQRAERELLQTKDALEHKSNELAHSLAMVSATLEAIGDGVLAVDRTGQITHYNQRFLDLWSIQPDNIAAALDEPALVRVLSAACADPQEFLASTERIIAQSPPESFDLLKLKSGDTLERYSKVRSVDGRFAGRVWTYRDITRRLRDEEKLQQISAENVVLLERSQNAQRELQILNETLEQQVTQRTAALTQSERQFQQLVAGVTDYAIYMLDPNGHIISWNPGAERIKGYLSSEIIGKHFSNFYTEEDREAGTPKRALHLAATRGKFEGEGWRMRKDGTRFWASVLIDPIRDASGTLVGYAKVTRDMTEYRAMQEQLHQSQKMEAIGQLTGGVAHDFNNLLTVILGNLDAIWRHLPAEDSRLRRAVDQASRGAQRAATLTQQLLAFARRQPLNPKPCDINRLVADMSDLMRRTLGENVAVETVLAGGLWRVDVDEHQLESAILNLAVNSRDAMPEGGKLTIETANAHLDDTYTGNFAEISPGQYVVICVSDTGTGMPRDVLARAFDPFFTTKPIGQGTGLGLSQVYGFVKQSNGHIKLYSEAGQGTTAKIYLPRLVDGLIEEEPERPAVIPEGRADETILVVEDDDDVRIYSTESLRELKFNVLEASSAESALRILDRHPEISLLFTDVGLPGANGRELVEAAHRRRPDLKVLFTTGYARNAIVHQGRLDPGVHLLTKPFTRAQLAARIREVLDIAPGRGSAVRKCALVAEDEELVRLFLVENLESIGLRVVQASTSAGALNAADNSQTIDVAIIDIGLPDRSGLDLARELRKRFNDLPLVIASGYGSGQLGSLSQDKRIAYLAKPYDELAVSRVLETLGVIATQERASI
jgi:PAS domain S-box-containing protein